MHLDDAQKIAINKKIVKEKFDHILEHRDEIEDMGRCAKTIWQALLDAPTWVIAETPKPEGWKEPEEIWSETPTVVHK